MLELKNVTKIFNKSSSNPIYALRDINIKFNRGEFVVLIGNNGAGKTTLLNAIAGTCEIDEGMIKVDDEDLTDFPEFKRAPFIGRVFQDPSEGTAAILTLEENLSLGQLKGKRPSLRKCVSRKKRKVIRELATSLGVNLESRLSDMALTLSGGQRQCLAIAMATINAPKILLLDEHDESLDPKTANLVMNLTERVIRSHEITTIMVTHSLERAMRHGDRLIMMVAGRIILNISAEERTKITLLELLSLFEENGKR